MLALIRFRAIGVLGIAAVAACATPPTIKAPEEAQETGPITYTCDDLVLVGRLAHQQFTPISDGYILGHGRIDFDVNVHRVIRGQEGRAVIPARVIAHTYAREDVDFLFVLKAGADERFDVITGWMLAPGQPQPQLASHCTASGL